MEIDPNKLERREKLIRIAGLFLMLSPFANFFLSVYFIDTIPNKWTLQGLGIIIRNGNPVHWALWFLSFSVGLFMIKGRRQSWMPALAVLGLFIVFNFMTLKKDMQKSTARPISLLLINMSMFALVYSQEFHQSTRPRRGPAKEPPPKQELEVPVATEAASAPLLLEAPSMFAAPQESPAAVAIQPQEPKFKEYEIHISDLLNKVVTFDGLGPWARIIEANVNEVIMEALGPVPPQMEKRKVEIVLRDKRVLKLRFKRQSGPRYVFAYREMIEAKTAV